MKLRLSNTLGNLILGGLLLTTAAVSADNVSKTPYWGFTLIPR